MTHHSGVKQKTIQLFLIDGTADGPVKASMLGWLGKVYSIPVKELKREDINSRNDLQNHSIYFLIGTENETDAPLIYVGQAGPRKSDAPRRPRLPRASNRLEHCSTPAETIQIPIIYCLSNQLLKQAAPSAVLPAAAHPPRR